MNMPIKPFIESYGRAFINIKTFHENNYEIHSSARKNDKHLLILNEVYIRKTKCVRALEMYTT